MPASQEREQHAAEDVHAAPKGAHTSPVLRHAPSMHAPAQQSALREHAVASVAQPA